MQQCDETDGAVNPRESMIDQALVCWLIPQDGGLPVAQLFSQKIVVSPLDIPFVLAALVFTYLTTKRFLLMLLYLYLCAMCFTLH